MSLKTTLWMIHQIMNSLNKHQESWILRNSWWKFFTDALLIKHPHQKKNKIGTINQLFSYINQSRGQYCRSNTRIWKRKKTKTKNKTVENPWNPNCIVYTTYSLACRGADCRKPHKAEVHGSLVQTLFYLPKHEDNPALPGCINSYTTRYSLTNIINDFIILNECNLEPKKNLSKYFKTCN